MEEDILIATEFINLSFVYGGKVAFTTENIRRYQKAVSNIINKNEELEKDLYSTNQLLNTYIDETKCLHCGKNVAGYCEECYQELIGANAKQQAELKEYKENALFICDPDKNKESKKTSCYINNGECMQTDNIKFRKNIECGIDKGSGEDQTAFERFIPENLIKFKLAKAEAKTKGYKAARGSGRTTEELVEIVELITEIKIYKELLDIN